MSGNHKCLRTLESDLLNTFNYNSTILCQRLQTPMIRNQGQIHRLRQWVHYCQMLLNLQQKSLETEHKKIARIWSTVECTTIITYISLLYHLFGMFCHYSVSECRSGNASNLCAANSAQNFLRYRFISILKNLVFFQRRSTPCLVSNSSVMLNIIEGKSIYFQAFYHSEERLFIIRRDNKAVHEPRLY